MSDLSADKPGAAPLRASSRALIGGTLIQVTGELDTSNVDLLTAYIQREHPKAEMPLVLELAGLTFLDTSGLHLLVEQHHRADNDGAGLYLAAPHERVIRVLDITGLLQLLRVHASLEQALTAADLIDPLSC